MSPRLHISPAAIDDVDQHASHIARTSPVNAASFLVATREAFDSLQDFPRRGVRRAFSRDRLNRLRSIQVHGFPNHLDFYKSTIARILIVRVLHGAQDLPNALSGRKRDPH